MIDVDEHLIARQMRRKGAVVAIGACLAPLSLFVLRSVLRDLVRGGGLFQVSSANCNWSALNCSERRPNC